MFFCPNCNNAFDIQKMTTQSGGHTMLPDSDTFTSSSQSGGDINDDIIKKIFDNKITNEEINLIPIKEFFKSISYKKLTSDEKEYVYNKIQDNISKDKKKIIKQFEANPQNSKIDAYFVCTNCGLTKKIESGTKIFTRSGNDVSQSYVSQEFKNLKHSNIHFYTRKYKCPNKKCESHSNPDKRESIYSRLNNSFSLTYICLACDTQF